MATYYFRNVGTNWGDAANWSLTDGGGATGVVPLATDDAVFTNNSGNCTVNALNRVCQTLNFNGGTGYINTITFTFNISVGGSITLGASMIFSGASLLRYVGIANSTFTSNGKEIGVPFEIAAATNNHTITYADNWTFGEDFTIQSGTATIMTFNGNTLNCKKSLLNNNTTTNRLIAGTTQIIMIGTGSIGSTSNVNVNIGLNFTINTAGSYTLNSLIWGYLGSKTFTYTAGTITVTANTTLTLRIIASATNTLNLNGIDFENITIGGGGTQTYTLTSNLKCKLMTQADNSTPIIMNGNTLFLTSFTNAVSLINNFSGTTIFYFNCWSGNGSFNAFRYSMTDTVVDISNGNTLFLGDGFGLSFFGLNFTHLQGGLIPVNTSFNGTFVDVLPNVVFNTIANSNGFSFTLKSNITVRNLGSINQAPNSFFTINGSGYSATILDSFINSQYITNAGTAKLIMGGNTDIRINIASFAAGIASEFEINTNGVVTFNTTTQAIFSGIFRHIKGQVIAKGTNVWFRNGATVLGASRCNFDNVQIDGGGTITMDEFFCGTPRIPTKVTSSGGNYTVNFQDGFEKIAKNVVVSNCTVGRRGQLLLLSKGSFRGTNIGIRYYNQSPNGVGSNLGTFVDNTLPSTTTFRKIDMLVGDPAYT
jgi:hypothetical protein